MTKLNSLSLLSCSEKLYIQLYSSNPTVTRCDSMADFDVCPCCEYSAAGKSFGVCPCCSYSTTAGSFFSVVFLYRVFTHGSSRLLNKVTILCMAGGIPRSAVACPAQPVTTPSSGLSVWRIRPSRGGLSTFLTWNPGGRRLCLLPLETLCLFLLSPGSPVLFWVWLKIASSMLISTTGGRQDPAWPFITTISWR